MTVMPGPQLVSAVPLAKAVNAYWAAFIKTGNPGSAGGPAWPKFAPNETYMEFSAAGPQPHDHFLKAQLDWQEEAVKGAVAGIFAASGQTCIAGSRLLVQRKIHNAFVDRLVDMLDGSTDHGSA